VTPQDLDRMMRAAVGAHQGGRLDEAAMAYRDVLTKAPGFPDAHHLLGLVFYQRRDYVQAEAEIRRAITGNPAIAMFWFNLGNVLRDARKKPDAIAAFGRAVHLQPGLPGAMANLANLLRESERFHEALPLYEQCMAEFPADDIAWNGAGCCYRSLGRLGDAERCLRRAVELKPASVVARINLAKVLCVGHGPDEALDLARQLASSGACDGEQMREIGNVFGRLRHSAEAEACFRDALRRDPQDQRARLELAGVLLESWQHDTAWAEYQGFFDSGFEAPPCLQTALMSALYFDRLSPAVMLDLHRRYDALIRKETGAMPSPMATPGQAIGARRIRIGFVSPDFRRHSCAHFFWPLVTRLDRTRFEVFAYANVAQPDAMTARIRGACDHWRDILGATAAEAGAMVRQDGIDLLVDMAGHTGDNAMPLFATRNAPVQATWLGYPATTGLATVDFRLTDAIADPVDEAGAHCTETLIRLPGGFLCYSSLEDPTDGVASPPPGAAAEQDAAIAPAGDRATVTFGSFNNLAKVTPAVLALWADIVLAVPGSRLALKAIQLQEADVAERVLAFLEARGVARDRVELHPWKSARKHLDSYRAIDIALDPFPYNGATTTCEALYMGVPVVALRGSMHVGRVGASILSAVGCPELIADDVEAYRQIAVGLAGDRARLDAFRQTLADRFRASPLHDAAGFARKFEQAVTTMLDRGGAELHHPR
jgi:predicted O-linked N-acetylglucosamine transferase (SPINDLY family)